MELLIVIIIITGGLLFIYFNIKLICKINFTTEFINIFMDVIIFKKNVAFIKIIDYKKVLCKILYKKENKVIYERYKKYLHYIKYLKYPMKIFVIKNISFYEECYENNLSIAIEFYIVNKVLKKSLLNG